MPPQITHPPTRTHKTFTMQHNGLYVQISRGLDNVCDDCLGEFEGKLCTVACGNILGNPLVGGVGVGVLCDDLCQ